VQAKIQKELDGFYSKGSVASMNDRDKIPYTSAAVYEVFRLSNILPISGPRKTMADVEYKGYFIEKDTAVAFNTYAVMRSKELWGDPDNFRPERFLDVNGGLNAKTQYTNIAFGVGKRACLGETLAQTTVFMAFTTLLRNFRFEPIPGKPLPSTEPIFGMILAPQRYEVIVKARN
jgi:methyl farnesoate epoxidase/farnesoate epoxidase